MTSFPLIDPTGERTAAFLRTVRDEDILRSVTDVSDDTLITLGTGLALEAFEGRYSEAVDAAKAYGIPGDVLELLTAAALTHLFPSMGALILSRPSEGSVAAVRGFLLRHGYQTIKAAPDVIVEVTE